MKRLIDFQEGIRMRLLLAKQPRWNGKQANAGFDTLAMLNYDFQTGARTGECTDLRQVVLYC